MTKPSFARQASQALRRVAGRNAAAAAAVAALSACASYPPPDTSAAPPAARDPILLGHAAWCGTNPPSGYCPSSYRR